MSTRTVLFVIAWLASISAGLSATLFSVYLPLLAAGIFGTTEKAAVAQTGSWAGGAYLFGWAVGSAILGVWSDRIGRKAAFLISILACTLGMIATAFVHDLVSLSLVRMVTGIGAGGILLLSTIMVSEAWRDHRHRVLLIGVLINAFPLGFVLSGLIQSRVADPSTAFLIGGASIIHAVLMWLFVQESDMWRSATHQMSHDRVRISDIPQRDLFIGVTLFGMMLVGLWAFYTWSPAWVHSISDPASAQANRSMTVIMLGLGAVGGGVISGAVSNALGRRRAIALGYIGVFAATVGIFTLTDTPSPLLFFMTFLVSFFIGFNQGVLSGYLPELFATRVRGTAMGLCFNVGRLITTVTVFFVGVLVTVLGGYEQAILVFAGGYLIGLITLIGARETRSLPA